MFPILNPLPFSLPVPSPWVIPVHQPQASSILHRTWTAFKLLISHLSVAPISVNISLCISPHPQPAQPISQISVLPTESAPNGQGWDSLSNKIKKFWIKTQRSCAVCVCVCIYIYMYMYICICMYTYMYIYNEILLSH